MFMCPRSSRAGGLSRCEYEVLLMTLLVSTVLGGCFLSVRSITSFDSTSSRSCGSRLTQLAARVSAVWRIFCFINRCCSYASRSALRLRDVHHSGGRGAARASGQHRVTEWQRRGLGAPERSMALAVEARLGDMRVRDRLLVVVVQVVMVERSRRAAGRVDGRQLRAVEPDHAGGGGGGSGGSSGRLIVVLQLLLGHLQYRVHERVAAERGRRTGVPARPTSTQMILLTRCGTVVVCVLDVPRCGRPSEMFGIEGELNSDRSLMLDRDAPVPYCGSSFSSWIGAFVGDARLPTVGGEFGPESVVPATLTGGLAMLLLLQPALALLPARCHRPVRGTLFDHALLLEADFQQVWLGCCDGSINWPGRLHLPVFRSGKSGSYLAIEPGGGGILYGWELTAAATAPPGSDSPDDDFTTPLQAKKTRAAGRG
uniref:Uncharacterized protein n=1 Tax=Anopheles atroparvus TaxID=41427 RepID=A0A182IR18_ANOAO